jgi:hypothetical protein
MDKASLKKALKVGRLVLTMDHYEDLLKRIREDNRSLKDLTSQSIRLEPSRQGRSRAKRLSVFRRYAFDIYNAIGSAIRCKCKDQHQAGLSLFRDNDEQPQPLGFTVERQFRVLISDVPVRLPHDMHWQQLQLELVPIAQDRLEDSTTLERTDLKSPKRKVGRVSFVDEILSRGNGARPRSLQPSAPYLVSSSLPFEPMSVGSDQTSTLQDLVVSEQILDLCGILKTQPNPALLTSLGVISDKRTKFKVHCPIQPVPPLPRRTVSLAQILNGKDASCARISFMEKLHMAAVVSSAVLELSRTPWMQSVPSKHDILFFENSPRLHTSAFIVTQIKGSVPEPESENDETLPSYIENKVLFSLGVLLIELLFGAALETLRTDKDPTSSNGMIDWALKYSIASRLLKDESILLEGGMGYESAVRSCIKCNFDQFRVMSLDNDEFRQAVYEKVVAALEDISRALGPTR